MATTTPTKKQKKVNTQPTMRPFSVYPKAKPRPLMNEEVKKAEAWARLEALKKPLEAEGVRNTPWPKATQTAVLTYYDKAHDTSSVRVICAMYGYKAANPDPMQKDKRQWPPTKTKNINFLVEERLWPFHPDQVERTWVKMKEDGGYEEPRLHRLKSKGSAGNIPKLHLSPSKASKAVSSSTSSTSSTSTSSSSSTNSLSSSSSSKEKASNPDNSVLEDILNSIEDEMDGALDKEAHEEDMREMELDDILKRMDTPVDSPKSDITSPSASSESTQGDADPEVVKAALNEFHNEQRLARAKELDRQTREKKKKESQQRAKYAEEMDRAFQKSLKDKQVQAEEQAAAELARTARRNLQLNRPTKTSESSQGGPLTISPVNSIRVGGALEGDLPGSSRAEQLLAQTLQAVNNLAAEVRQTNNRMQVVEDLVAGQETRSRLMATDAARGRSRSPSPSPFSPRKDRHNHKKRKHVSWESESDEDRMTDNEKLKERVVVKIRRRQFVDVHCLTHSHLKQLRLKQQQNNQETLSLSGGAKLLLSGSQLKHKDFSKHYDWEEFQEGFNAYCDLHSRAFSDKLPYEDIAKIVQDRREWMTNFKRLGMNASIAVRVAKSFMLEHGHHACWVDAFTRDYVWLSMCVQEARNQVGCPAGSEYDPNWRKGQQTNHQSERRNRTSTHSARSSKSAPANNIPPHYCFSRTSLKTECKKGAACHFLHTCASCGVDHTADQCKAAGTWDETKKKQAVEERTKLRVAAGYRPRGKKR